MNSLCTYGIRPIDDSAHLTFGISNTSTMRFLLICFLFSTILSAQKRIDLSSQYVWAESGLTMRAEGNAEGEKMMVIPFGAEVKVTGEWGEYLKVKAMDGVRYETKNGTSIGEPYLMEGEYERVEYGGKTGYVFNGYLFYCPPEDKGSRSEDFETWMTSVIGLPDTILFEDDTGKMMGSRHMYLFPNGMTLTYEEYEGGGSTTITFPIGSIANGFTVANHFWNVDQAVKNKKDFNGQGGIIPELLKILDDGSLHFQGDMSETKIMVAGGILIIYSAGGC